MNDRKFANRKHETTNLKNILIESQALEMIMDV